MDAVPQEAVKHEASEEDSDGMCMWTANRHVQVEVPGITLSCTATICLGPRDPTVSGSAVAATVGPREPTVSQWAWAQ